MQEVSKDSSQTVTAAADQGAERGPEATGKLKVIMKELGVVKVPEVMIDNGLKRDRRSRSDERARDGDGAMNHGGYRSDKRARGDDGAVAD